MSNFGIRQTFRTQPISRKVGRSKLQDNKDIEEKTEIVNETTNIFESQNNVFSNRAVNRSSVQKPLLTPIGNASASSSDSNKSSNSSNDELITLSDNINKRKLVSARIKLMKNHNRGVTRSEDYL